MAFPRVYHLAIGAALAVGSWNVSAHAQFSRPPAADTAEAAEEGTTKGAANANPRAAWDNPEMRLRMLKASFTGFGGGGPGGMRGGGGRGGRGGPGGPQAAPERPSAVTVMIGLLQRSPILQDEIKLTDEQKEQIKQVAETVNEKRRDMFSNRQNNGGQNGGAQNGGRGNRGGGNNFDFQAMRTQMTALAQESEAAILKILTKPQKLRLSQIALQIEGPMAVSRPEIAKSLKLNETQVEKIMGVLAQMQLAQQEIMMAQMTQMRGLFGGGRGGPGGGGPGGGGPGGQAATPPRDNAVAATKGAGGDATKDANNRGGRNRPQMTPEAQEAMQTAMKTAGEQQDQLQAKAETAIAKVLTKSQKATFNKLLGPEFDIAALANENTGRGGFGGPGGPGGRGGPGGDAGGQGGRRGGPGGGEAAPGGQGGATRGGRNAAATR